MIALTDQQLQTVLDAASRIDIEKREMFLQRVEAMLRMRGLFNDQDLKDICALALAGLARPKPFGAL
jgi:hypothetical protein